MQFWADFLRLHARWARNGIVEEGPSVTIAWADSLLFLNNSVFLSRPSTGVDDLRHCARQADQFAARRDRPWTFYVYEPWVRSADEVGQALGDWRFSLQIMTCRHGVQLLPPVRPLPRVTVRPIVTDDEKRLSIDCNTRAYGMPPEMTASVLDSGFYFAAKDREFGFLAFNDQGDPVSTASILVLDSGWLYVEAVATDPAHRNRGYAEAVMRAGLEQVSAATGIRRSALDASGMGEPLYRQMGYESHARWFAYPKTPAAT